MTDRRFEEAAVRLAMGGYHVFPIKAREKKPLTANGWHDATDNERQILHWWERWPTANIGVACGPTGIAVVDVDSKHGADPREVIAELVLDGFPVVWTGEAPEPDERHPDSLPGVRGAHVYLRGGAPTGHMTLNGVEVRAAGAYVIAPPSVHPSGVPYQGALPPVRELPPVPSSLARLARATAAPPPPGESIEAGRRHTTLVALAVDLVRRGVTDPDAVRGALLEINRVRFRPPLEAQEVVGVAAWAAGSQIADGERACSEFIARWCTRPQAVQS